MGEEVAAAAGVGEARVYRKCYPVFCVNVAANGTLVWNMAYALYTQDPDGSAPSVARFPLLCGIIIYFGCFHKGIRIPSG